MHKIKILVFVVLGILWSKNLFADLPDEGEKTAGAMGALVIADGQSMLEAADAQRAPWNSMIMLANVTSETNLGIDNRQYTIFHKDAVKTLVLLRKPVSNKGDLVLMDAENLWFYQKKSRRPIRITPIQRLTGAVSYGDVARINWSYDYTVEQVIGEEKLESGDRALLLSLKAKTKSATYNSIKLWLTPEAYTPIKAEVYLLSGKKFKSIDFLEYSEVDGKFVNTSMKIIDHLQKSGSSMLTFSEIGEKSLPDRIFLKTALPNFSESQIR